MKSFGLYLAVWLCLVGCSSPQPLTYYQFSARLAPIPRQSSHFSLTVGPVTLPSSIDRPQLVLSTGHNTVEVLKQSLWAAPLSQLIAQTIADNLARALGLEYIYATPQLGSLHTDYTLLIVIHQLAARPGYGVALDASWAIMQGRARMAAGRFTKEEEGVPPAQSIIALISLYDLLWATFSQDLARQIAQLRIEEKAYQQTDR